MKKFFENKPRAWFVIGSILVLLVTAGAVIYLLLNNNEQQDPNVLARIGDEEITQGDLDKAIYGISFNDGIKYTDQEKDARLKQLIEYAIANKESSGLGVNVTEEEVDKYISKNILNYLSYDDNQKSQTRETVKNTIMLDKVKVAAVGWREANYLVFNFHKYFQTDSKEYQVEGMGDEALIQQTKSNALAYATDLSKRLRTGTITYEDAKKELYEHKEFGIEALLPRTPDTGGKILKEYFIEDILDQSQRNALLNLNLNEVSDPIVDTGKASEMGGKELEYRYFVYQITGVGNSDYGTYKEWLEAMKVKYHVEFPGNLSFVSQRAFAAAPASCANTCNIDNAELYITMQYYAADGSPNSLTAGTFAVVGGTPWAKNDGSDCGNPARSSSIAGTPNPTWSSCDTAGQSFYCASDSVMYLILNEVPIAGTDQSKGVWTWDKQTAANTYPGFPSGGRYTPGSRWSDLDSRTNAWGTDWADLSSYGGAIALLNLRAGRNVENEQMNGKLIQETFSWHPHWLPQSYNLTVNISPTAAATAKGAGAYTAGSSATASYANVSADYEFSNWSGDAGCGSAMTMNGNKTCTANFTRRLTDVSCSVSPETGLSPLVVRINFSGGVPPYTVSTDGYTFADRTSPLYYTFGSAGEKTITVSDSNSTTRDCVVPVTVNNPTNTDGGEVAP